MRTLHQMLNSATTYEDENTRKNRGKKQRDANYAVNEIDWPLLQKSR